MSKRAAKKLQKNFEETLWDSANKLRGSVELSIFLSKFAFSEGKGEFCTPKSIVNPFSSIAKDFNWLTVKIVDKNHCIIEENQKLNNLLPIFLFKMTKAEATA
jgi:hypothetical protein